MHFNAGPAPHSTGSLERQVGRKLCNLLWMLGLYIDAVSQRTDAHWIARIRRREARRLFLFFDLVLTKPHREMLLVASLRFPRSDLDCFRGQFAGPFLGSVSGCG